MKFGEFHVQDIFKLAEFSNVPYKHYQDNMYWRLFNLVIFMSQPNKSPNINRFTVVVTLIW